jgi:hypothetical protein
MVWLAKLTLLVTTACVVFSPKGTEFDPTNAKHIMSRCRTLHSDDVYIA